MLIGHQWLLNTLGVKPKSSWSVDPFGHGSAFPYVLKASGVDGMYLYFTCFTYIGIAIFSEIMSCEELHQKCIYSFFNLENVVETLHDFV